MRAVRFFCLSALLVCAVLWIGGGGYSDDANAAGFASTPRSGSFDSKPAPPVPELVVRPHNGAVAPTPAKTLPASRFIHESRSPISTRAINTTTARAHTSRHLRDIPLLI